MIRPLPFLTASLLLAGCAGVGPGRSGLGAVVANIVVTDGKGATCNVSVTNGKDQTGLTLKGLHVCGGSLDELHADRSDGAAVAINANADVAKTLGGQALGLVGAAIQGGLAVTTGKPPKLPGLPPVDPNVPPLVTAPPSLRPGLYLGPAGHQRRLLVSPPGSARYVSEGGTEHLIAAAEWRRWVVQPLSLDASP